jgi:MinD superfamily P-loop ATPase
MHLLLNPDIIQADLFKGGKIAVKDEKKCTDCGLCYQVCRFGAITPDEFNVNPIKCDGCNVCVTECPTDALGLVEKKTGYIYRSESEFGPMIHGKLKAGGDNSGKLVSQVRKEADRIAVEKNKDLILIDGSPGIGCPVIASLNGVDAALLITEPTKSGLSDLKRVLEVTKHFGINTMVAVNKFDLNEEITIEIENFCQEREIPIVGRIPFDSAVNESLRKGELLIRYKEDSRSAIAINTIWKKIRKILID